jgi:tetratricopeptide (TPR) repeat protein
MSRRTCQFFWMLFLLIGLILTLPTFGQYREYYLYGKVLDIQKNPMEGVDISIRDADTNRSYSTKTKKDGEYKFVGLPHGTYKVVFKKEGYAEKEDEWKFETPQDKIQKVEIPPVVLVSQVQAQEQKRMKEMQGAIQEVADKFKQKDYDGAIALLKGNLEKNPKDANSLYLLGMSYSRKQMYSEAINALTQVTELIPKFAPAFFELAVCYQQQKDLEKALDSYQKTIELDPNNPDAAYNSGLILFGMNRVEEALGRFEKALSLKPDDAAYLEMAGRCYINQANFQKAIDYLEKAKSGNTDAEKIKFLDDLIIKLKEQIKK